MDGGSNLQPPRVMLWLVAEDVTVCAEDLEGDVKT